MEKLKSIEICCGSYEDALSAHKGGAKRIELNSALYLGGLTPTLGSLQLTKKNTDLKVICMIRPRSAGFCYSEDDFNVMKADAELMMKNGADGLAFGCLTANEASNAKNKIIINIEQTKTIIDIAHKYGGEAVFHRAFDCVSDPFETIEKLIDLKVDRILTSGQALKAWDGRNLIGELQKKYGDKIEILAGSGINADNALQLVKATEITQIHSSCKAWKEDFTTEGKNVSFSYTEYPQQNKYEVVSEQLVKKLISLFK